MPLATWLNGQAGHKPIVAEVLALVKLRLTMQQSKAALVLYYMISPLKDNLSLLKKEKP
jgi:hypothetical protein